ncbi:MAG: AMP-binding protein [Oscillospiraceae bacterium]|nr:AMP-binding protein [Oscillospiraceae bacterium]
MVRNIHLDYVKERYGPGGVLWDYKINCPENFNFAYDIVDNIGVNDPDRRAMLWLSREKEEETFTFGQMRELSNKTANYFRSLGIGKGDPVLVVLKRHYQFWLTALALHKLGAIMIPATFMLTKHDFEYRINSALATAIVCTSDGDTAQALDDSLPDSPTLRTRILVGGKREGWSDFDEEMPKFSSELERVENKSTDPLIMFFSSGTSGYPKMVLHDHSYPLGHLITAKHWHRVDPEGLHFTIADTGWGKALWGKLYGQWLMEAGVFTYDFDKFDAADILSIIQKYRLTSLCCPPTMFRMFLNEGVDKYDLSSLKAVNIAGEALNPDTFDRWYKATGLKLMEGFGQTETCCTVLNLNGMNPKPGSMGKPSPQYHVEIVDEEGMRCLPGETGEIVIACEPRPVGLMSCYYRNEEKTNEVMHDGWYHTGDTAWMDEDGYYWYVGRTDDIIKSSGYRIGPFEIESVLIKHPAVSDCAITGVPDEVRGQLVKATIVLTDGYEASEELKKELQNYVKKETSPYKYPRVVEFVSELPRTINGKIRRVDIRKSDAEK